MTGLLIFCVVLAVGAVLHYAGLIVINQRITALEQAVERWQSATIDDAPIDVPSDQFPIINSYRDMGKGL